MSVPTDTPCSSEAKTCGECISSHPQCAWCSGKLSEGASRCALQDVLAWTCSGNEVEPSSLHVQRLTFTKKKPVRTKRPISPQRIELAIRKGASIILPIDVFALKSTVALRLRHSRAVAVDVMSDCKRLKLEKKSARCVGISRGKVDFRLNVKIKRCLPKPKTIRVMVDGNRKKALKIKVTSICNCDCEKEAIPKTPQCSGQGNLTCGVCLCRPEFYGKACECDAAIVRPEEVAARCTRPGHTTVCSGRGDCVCGFCQCHSRGVYSAQKYSGEYCECDDYSCDNYDGELCGGRKRGVCKCGKCQCFDGYEGAACGFSLNAHNCYSPISGTVCNGLGLCINNQCECLAGYRGETCDECSKQGKACTKLCLALKPCVQCFAYKSGELTAEKCERRCGFMKKMATFVDDVVVQERGGPVFRMCMFRDEDGCYFKFSTNFHDKDAKQQIKLEKTKMCPDDY